MYEAPQIRLSYPGSAELHLLWADLERIGWTIPERPPIPYQASAWVGDGGHAREHEYRVEDFEILSGDWPTHEIADRGIETVNLLRRMGVDVHMPISYLDFLRKTQLNQNKTSERPEAVTAPRPVPEEARHHIPDAALASPPISFDRPRLAAVPDLAETSAVPQMPVVPVHHVPQERVTVDIPEVVLLSTKAWSVLQTEPGLDVYQSVVVPGRTRWTWSETTNSVDELGSSLPDPRILFETVELGWQRTKDEVPAITMDPETDRVLWFIVHNFHEATTLTTFLHENRETSARIVPMSPLPKTTAFDNCFLVGAVVPATDFAKIGSKVVANYGDVIARGKPSPLADTATTFSR